MHKDMPIKENDHAMDDIRYFVSTVLSERSDDFLLWQRSAVDLFQVRRSRHRKYQQQMIEKKKGFFIEFP